jgi:putative aminopeptidase FrvX
MFARYGAVDVPLSWPARYSHSPVETIDLLDVWSLAKLIAAVAGER